EQLAGEEAFPHAVGEGGEHALGFGGCGDGQDFRVVCRTAATIIRRPRAAAGHKKGNQQNQQEMTNIFVQYPHAGSGLHSDMACILGKEILLSGHKSFFPAVDLDNLLVFRQNWQVRAHPAKYKEPHTMTTPSGPAARAACSRASPGPSHGRAASPAARKAAAT